MNSILSDNDYNHFEPINHILLEIDKNEWFHDFVNMVKKMTLNSSEAIEQSYNSASAIYSVRFLPFTR